MTLDDRLFIAAESLREAAEDPVDHRRLAAAALRFSALLAESSLADVRLVEVVRSTGHGLTGTPRPGFDEAYVKEGLKAAFFLLGIYEAIHGFR